MKLTTHCLVVGGLLLSAAASSDSEISAPVVSAANVGIKTLATEYPNPTIAEIRDKQRPFKQLFNLIRDTHTSPPADYAKHLMSRPLDLQQAAQLFNAAISDEAWSCLNQALDRELQSIMLFADTVPALTQLKAAGFKLGICSNLGLPYAHPIERLLPFAMDAYGWSFAVGAIKPDPAIYHHVCNQLGSFLLNGRLVCLYQERGVPYPCLETAKACLEMPI